MLTFDATTQAELDACATKKDWCDTLIAAISATRTLTCKWAASGDPWAGSTFYSGPLTGAMVVSSGAVGSLGDVASATVALAADLSSGGAVLRVTGASGRWMQGTLGLSGTDFVLPGTIGSGVRIALSRVSRVKAPSVLPIGAPPEALPGFTVATMEFRNQTGANEPAHRVSKMFGVVFKEGDIAAGEWPQFLTAGGLFCPATIWGEAYWPDGSMRFCAVMMRIPVAINAGATATITIRDGGVQPPAAGISPTLDIIASSDIKVTLDSLSNWGAAGPWTSALNTGLVGTGVEVQLLGTGHAGLVMRVYEPFRSASGPHAQAGVFHYFAALQSEQGEFDGLRHCGAFKNGWHDVTSPQITDMTAKNVRLMNGATVLRAIETTLTPQTFSRVSNVLTWSATSALSQGQPVELTGSLPSGMSADKAYYVRPGAGLAFTLHETFLGALNNTAGSSIAAGGWGPVTAKPVFTLDAYACGPFTLGPSGEWDQVTGIAPVCEPVIDRTYTNSSKVMGPRRTDITFAILADRSYRHDFLQDVDSYENGTGERPDIGYMTAWSFRHWGRGDRTKTIRTYALQQTINNWSIRRRWTLAPLNMTDVVQTGMGTPVPAYIYRPGNPAANNAANVPVSQQRLWPVTGAAHKPLLQAYAYMITGEPQYLDLLHDTMTHSFCDMPKTTVVNGVNYRGIALLDPQPRASAWTLRDFGYAAMFTPPTWCGSSISAYAKQVISNSAAYIQAARAVGTTFTIENGFFPTVTDSPSCWQISYMLSAFNVAYTATQDANLKLGVEQILKSWDGTRQNLGLYNADAYYWDYTPSATGMTAWTNITAKHVVGGLYVDLGTNVFTCVDKSPLSGTLTNGRPVKIPGFQPAPLSANLQYFMRDVDVGAGTFKLAATVGGAEIDITAWSANFGKNYGQNDPTTGALIPAESTSANLPGASATQFQTSNTSKAYSTMMVGCTRWSEALGFTVPAGWKTAIDAAYGAGPSDFAGDPVWALKNTFGA